MDFYHFRELGLSARLHWVLLRRTASLIPACGEVDWVAVADAELVPRRETARIS